MKPVDPDPLMLLRRRRLCAGLAFATTAPLWARMGPASADEGAPAGAAAAGPAVQSRAAPSETPAFTTRDLDWHDDARQRAVPVRLYLPAQASAAQPVPLVVFSHGIGGSRRGYSYLGQHWAGQGYASLHLQHVGSDRGIWMGSPWSLVGRLHDAAQEQEAINRPLDLRFALNQLMGSAHGALIDAQRIIAAGHSYGANTTLLAVGARVERQGRVLDLQEPRIKAAIVISAPPFYGEPDPHKLLSSIQVPTLHITATEDVIRIPGYYSGMQDRLDIFAATGGARKVLAVFEGGSHSIFTDRAGTGGVTLNPQIKQATQALSAAFLQSVLRADDAALRDWPARYAALVARYEAAPSAAGRSAHPSANPSANSAPPSASPVALRGASTQARAAA